MLVEEFPQASCGCSHFLDFRVQKSHLLAIPNDHGSASASASASTETHPDALVQHRRRENVIRQDYLDGDDVTIGVLHLDLVGPIRLGPS